MLLMEEGGVEGRERQGGQMQQYLRQESLPSSRFTSWTDRRLHASIKPSRYVKKRCQEPLLSKINLPVFGRWTPCDRNALIWWRPPRPSEAMNPHPSRPRCLYGEAPPGF